jgi:hypothetical protein
MENTEDLSLSNSDLISSLRMENAELKKELEELKLSVDTTSSYGDYENSQTRFRTIFEHSNLSNKLFR